MLKLILSYSTLIQYYAMHTDNLIHCILSLQIFMRMGLPKIIATDNGTEFKNELNKHLMELTVTALLIAERYRFHKRDQKEGESIRESTWLVCKR